jgi:hypothetical protein
MTPSIKVGDKCIYVMEFDSDTSYTPNIGPAIVAKVNSNGNPDLVVLTLNGIFFKANVLLGSPTQRSTYHLIDPA